MGLDMYLHKVRKGLDPRNITEVEDYDGDNVEIGYWRKFNALHDRFGGGSNCEYIKLSLGQLIDTLADCKRIMALVEPYEVSPEDDDHFATYELPDEVEAEIIEILPPCSGFFFGSTDIDAWYLGKVQETIPILEEALNAAAHGYDIYYYAWW